jgi:transposase
VADLFAGQRALRRELAELRAQNAELCRVSELQVERLAAFEQLTGQLREANARLQEMYVQVQAEKDRLAGRVAELERRGSRNSGNSSMPPSTDDQPGKPVPPRRARRESGRRRGKQPGAPGAGLAWRENPDQRVEHYPAGACGCGRALEQAEDLGVDRSHQVHDVPLVTVTVTQHDLHRVRCRCGREHVAVRPAEIAAAATSYGLNLQALVVYLLVVQHLPVERAAQLVADVTGAAPSTGFVHSLLARAAGHVEEVVTRIKTLITLAHVVGFDETTSRVGPAGTKRYVLTACTEGLIAFGLGGRDLGSFAAFGILPHFTGIAVHDRYANYDHLLYPMSGHQLCAAHLLRDLTDAAESYPEASWPAQASRALRRLVRSWHDAVAAGQAEIPAELRAPAIRALRRAVADGLAAVPRIDGPKAKQRPARTLLECLHDREADVLRFTTDTRVWPTNNISERGLRPEKTQQKISGRLQSEQITRHRLALRSYLGSAARHGENLMSALRDAMAGNPWTPPQPIPT